MCIEIFISVKTIFSVCRISIVIQLNYVWRLLRCVSAKFCFPHIMSRFRHRKRKRTLVVFQRPVQRFCCSRCAVVKPVRISSISGFALERRRSRLLSIYGERSQRIPFQEGASKTTAGRPIFLSSPRTLVRPRFLVTSSPGILIRPRESPYSTLSRNM